MRISWQPPQRLQVYRRVTCKPSVQVHAKRGRKKLNPDAESPQEAPAGEAGEEPKASTSKAEKSQDEEDLVEGPLVDDVDGSQWDQIDLDKSVDPDSPDGLDLGQWDQIDTDKAEPRSQEGFETEDYTLLIPQEILDDGFTEESITIPPTLQLKPGELKPFLSQLSREHWYKKQWESEAIEDRAWQAHARQNKEAVNKYLCVRYIASLMTLVEQQDYAAGSKAPGHISSWTRAELAMNRDFEGFNKFCQENLEKMIITPPPEYYEEKELEAASALSPMSDRDVDEVMGSSDGRVRAIAMTDDLMDQLYLDGILPGVSLASLGVAGSDDLVTLAADEGDLV